MSSSAPIVPREPSSLPGLPEPLQRLRGTDDGDDYPICWSSEGSAERTKGPLLEAVQPLLDEAKAAAGPGSRARILEIASGLGEHIQHLAVSNPEIDFQPTECDPHLVARLSQASAGVTNVLPGLVLNALSPTDWASVRSHFADDGKRPTFDGVVMQNILHIAPEGVTTAVFEHLAPLLNISTGWISIYGPFISDGKHASDADKAFDDHIRARSPQLGLRDITRFIAPEAERFGFKLVERKPMPKGNWTLVFRPRARVSEYSMRTSTHPF